MLEDAATAKRDLVRGQNGHLRIILPPEKYYQIANTPFFLLPNTGITVTVAVWTLAGEEKCLIQ